MKSDKTKLKESIKNFERSYKEYLNEDGSINKLGLSQLRRVRFIPFNWNNRKIDTYEEYHLSERTKKNWKLNTEYRKLRDQIFK